MGMFKLMQEPILGMTEGHADPPFRKLGKCLMNQQCWSWGCDIRRPQGNLLLAFGFERLRPPADAKGSSRYRLALRSGREISLWGFGTLISDGVNAVHVGRFQFDAQLCSALSNTQACWSPSSLPPLRRPFSPHELALAGSLCSELLGYIGDYESWVAETVGIRYRQQTLDKFKDTVYSAAEAKQLWPRLAKQVARHYGRRAARKRIATSGSRYHAASVS